MDISGRWQRTERPRAQSDAAYASSPRSGNTARRVATIAWSRRSAGSYPDSQSAQDTGHRPSVIRAGRQLPRTGEDFLPPALRNHRLGLDRPPRGDGHQMRPRPRYDVHDRVPPPPSAIHRPSAYSCASS